MTPGNPTGESIPDWECYIEAERATQEAAAIERANFNPVREHPRLGLERVKAARAQAIQDYKTRKAKEAENGKK